MAVFTPIRPPKPIEISKFLGLNESVGDTEIKLGESVLQENFSITNNYKAKKRPGQHVYIESETVIRGAWYGKFDGVRTIIFATGGKLYKRLVDVFTIETEIANLLYGGWNDALNWDDTDAWNDSENAPLTSIGNITDEQTEFMWHGDKLYIKTFHDYLTYDGTSLSTVTPKVPLIVIGSPPAGGGTLFEEVNLLSTSREVNFTANGTDATFTLPEKPVASIVTVKVNGVSASYTSNLTNGTVTISPTPVNEADVNVVYTVATSQASLIMNHPYMIDYGTDSDVNIFIFGGTHEKHRFRYSMVGDPTYFPASCFTTVGTDQFAINDLLETQQSLFVFKENSGFLVDPVANPLYENNTGLNPYTYGYKRLNESVGCSAVLGSQLIQDTPISIDGFSFWRWAITNVDSQRSAEIISDRLKLSLSELDLSTAVTLNNISEKEFWVNVDNVVYIWNYGNDTFYKYTGIEADRFFMVDDRVFYFGDKCIRDFDQEYKSDNTTLGTNIPCVMKLGFTDFGQLEYRKIMRNEWFSISPDSNTSLDIKFVTDRDNETEVQPYRIEYKWFDYNDIDYNDFSYETNVNPQPKRIKGKVKKFTYLQVMFENDTNDESLTILKMLLQAQAQGFSR